MINIFEHYLLGEKLYSQIVSDVCKKYELTYMEFTVLMFLANNPQFDTASDIVKYRSLTKSHVSLSIRTLGEKGLLNRQFLGEDRRSIHLKLSDIAAPIINDGRQAQKKYVDLIYAGLKDDDKKEMLRIMEIINTNIKNNLDELRK